MPTGPGEVALCLLGSVPGCSGPSLRHESGLSFWPGTAEVKARPSFPTGRPLLQAGHLPGYSSASGHLLGACQFCRTTRNKGWWRAGLLLGLTATCQRPPGRGGPGCPTPESLRLIFYSGSTYCGFWGEPQTKGREMSRTGPHPIPGEPTVK